MYLRCDMNRMAARVADGCRPLKSYTRRTRNVSVQLAAYTDQVCVVDNKARNNCRRDTRGSMSSGVEMFENVFR